MLLILKKNSCKSCSIYEQETARQFVARTVPVASKITTLYYQVDIHYRGATIEERKRRRTKVPLHDIVLE